MEDLQYKQKYANKNSNNYQVIKTKKTKNIRYNIKTARYIKKTAIINLNQITEKIY